MFLLFRRQKSLALNRTDEIPGDNEFENHCGLKVVSTYTVRSLEEIFHREERKTNLEVTDSYGYVCTRETSWLIWLTSSVGSFIWRKIPCNKKINSEKHEATLNWIISSATIIVISGKVRLRSAETT